MSLNGSRSVHSLISSFFFFYLVRCSKKKKMVEKRKQIREKEAFQCRRFSLDRWSVKSFISAHTEQRSIPKGAGGRRGRGCIFKTLVKKHPCPQISEISQGRVEKITRGEPPHTLSFLFFFCSHLLSEWKKATLFPVYFLGASPLKLPCVLAVEDWAVCMGKCTSAVSLPNQIEFWCRACVFLRSKKPSHFFSL